MATFRHGKSAFFSIADSGATVRDISTGLNDVSFPQTIETAETTSFGDNAKTYIVGLSDSKISVKGNFDATFDGYLAGILQLSGGSAFVYGPAGNTSGYVKLSGTALLTSLDRSSSVGGVVTTSAEFQVTGAVTRGTF